MPNETSCLKPTNVGVTGYRIDRSCNGTLHSHDFGVDHESTSNDPAASQRNDRVDRGRGDFTLLGLRHWRQRYDQDGYDALVDPDDNDPRRRVPLEVLHLYCGRYFDSNVQKSGETLGEEHKLTAGDPVIQVTGRRILNPLLPVEEQHRETGAGATANRLQQLRLTEGLFPPRIGWTNNSI